jgi:hypothetical protein
MGLKKNFPNGSSLSLTGTNSIQSTKRNAAGVTIVHKNIAKNRLAYSNNNTFNNNKLLLALAYM